MKIRGFEKFKRWREDHKGATIAMVRCDLNIPSEIDDSSRIHAIRDTVLSLSNLGLKVILISHYKRPRTEDFFDKTFSLKPIAEKVQKILGKSVDFIPNSIFEIERDSIKSEITLLENLRFYPGEKANDDLLARELTKLADVYINDAFSVSHRAHASVDAITHFLPSFAGMAFDREISGISTLTSSIRRPYTAIVGGAKISSKIEVLKAISQKADTLIISGAMANTFLAAQGVDLGKSLVEPDFFELSLEISSKSKAKIVLPSDFICASDINSKGGAYPLNDVPNGMACFDIGPKTIQNMKDILEKSQTLLWNGALGAFEFSNFYISSNEISAYIAKMTKENGLISVIGGGETVASIGEIKDKMSFVSTSGGAFLEYVSGYNLPGVTALSIVER